MQNKSDVKAIMARFQGSGGSIDESSTTRPVGRPKQSVYPTLSSGPIVHTKKPVLESLSGSAVGVPPKPSFLKNTVSAKSDTEVAEPNKTKALASRFSNGQENTSTISKPVLAKKEQPVSKPPLCQASEAKDLRQKPQISKLPLNSSFTDSKPAIPKPPLGGAAASKPSWVKEDSGGGDNSPPVPKTPLAAKPTSGMLRLRQQNEEAAADSGSLGPMAAPVAAAKPQASNFKAAQNMFNKEPDKTEQSDSKAGAVPPKPPTGKKPSLKKPSGQAGGADDEVPGAPKRKPLPNIFHLGTAPAKPSRPPKVNLEPFKQGAESCDAAPGTLKKPVVPVSQASQPGGQVASSPALPSLPPRHPTTLVQQEDFYDDIDDFSNTPPPLPPAAGHPSHRASKAQEEEDDDDGEMYEDLDERWDAAEQKQDRKGKKPQEVEKKDQKEQKEREKKEQEARKKFKLVGPLTAVHQVKAHLDCKGSKTDLTLKQGECLDIIRVQGNPEGKWLGRSQDGSIGYVKTTSVEIDFNSLKAHKAQPTYDPEVYDDIDVPSTEKSSFKGPGVVLPPLPGEEGEIYDDVVDPNLEVSASDIKASPLRPLGFLRMFDRSRRAASSKEVPPPSQFNAENNSDQPGAAIDEEVYDDVDSTAFPPLPPISSLPTFKGKNKSEDAELKRQKKMEKEEKEFRKKFKYDGDINVLYQATVIPTLTNKKWASKDLPVKAGERLDVIMKATGDKLICRNEEGKFGYVSTSNTVMEDGDIYDDIGNDCIYDND